MTRITTLIAAASLTALATAAAAQDNMIAKMDVDVEFDDAANANALQYWPKIETDLESVLAAYAAPVTAGNGYDVTIRLTDVSLSGTEVLTDKGEFNHMEGWVYVRNQGEAEPVDSFKVIVDAQTGAIPVGADMIVLPGMDDFYVALLNGFADKTVSSIGAIGK